MQKDPWGFGLHYQFYVIKSKGFKNCLIKLTHPSQFY